MRARGLSDSGATRAQMKLRKYTVPVEATSRVRDASDAYVTTPTPVSQAVRIDFLGLVENSG